MRLLFVLFMITITFVIVSCGTQEVETKPTEGIYRPPTQIPVEPAPVDSPDIDDETAGEEPQPTPTPVCSDGLWFLQDITIPDGTVVEPGEKLDKRWEIRNSGNCNWNENYSIQLVAGPGMGVPVKQALAPALSGTDFIIRMLMIAPDEPGNYRSAWQGFDPQGNPFGNTFYIDIVVVDIENEGE